MKSIHGISCNQPPISYPGCTLLTNPLINSLPTVLATFI